MDQLAGVPDNNNQFTDAGFDPQGMGYSVGPFYFISTERWEKRTTFKVKMSGFIDCDGHDNWVQDTYLSGEMSGCETDDVTSFPANCWDGDPDRAYKHILKYCWNPDCGSGAPGQNLMGTIPFPSIVCPQNYKPVELTKFVQSCTDGQGCKKSFGDGTNGTVQRLCQIDQDDYIDMEYKCTPVNDDGWYKDDDPGAGLLVEEYKIPSGWRGQNKTVKMIDPINVAADGTQQWVSEEAQYRGVTLFSVANAGENKAYSDRLWSETAYKYFPTNAAASIPYNEACTPYGASDLNSAPSENDVVKLSDTCGDDKPEDIPGGQQLWKGGYMLNKNGCTGIFVGRKERLDRNITVVRIGL